MRSLATLTLIAALVALPACQPQGASTPITPTQQTAPSPAAVTTLSGLVRVPLGVIAPDVSAVVSAGGLNAEGGNVISAGSGNVISAGSGNVISAGGGNVISAGGGNVISAGGGNVISAGSGNAIAGAIGQVISAGGGNVISAGGGNVISAGGGNVISAGGGNVVSAGGLNYEVQSLDQVPLAGAVVFLTDLQGKPIPGVDIVVSDQSGRYEIRNVPRGITFLVVTRIIVAGGQTIEFGTEASLATIATSKQEAVQADLSLASTMTTAAIYQQAAVAPEPVVLGTHMEDTFSNLVEQFDVALGTDAGAVIQIDALVVSEALNATLQTIAEQVPAIKEAITAVKEDLVEPQDQPPPVVNEPVVAPIVETGVKDVVIQDIPASAGVTIQNGTVHPPAVGEAIHL